MKQISKLLAPLAFAAASLFASQAHAAGQYASFSNYLGSATYIGILDPTAKPTESPFVQDQVYVPAGGGSFTDYWVFDINPSGNVVGNMQFTNSGGSFDAFSVSVYLVQAPIVDLSTAAYTCASQSQASGAVTCASGPGGLTLVPTINNYNNNGETGNASAKTTQFLTAGRYVVEVSGVTTLGGTNPVYSGSIQTNQIPEPGTLALAGLALLGSAAAMRKRKQA